MFDEPFTISGDSGNVEEACTRFEQLNVRAAIAPAATIISPSRGEIH